MLGIEHVSIKENVHVVAFLTALRDRLDISKIADCAYILSSAVKGAAILDFLKDLVISS